MDSPSIIQNCVRSNYLLKVILKVLVKMLIHLLQALLVSAFTQV